MQRNSGSADVESRPRHSSRADTAPAHPQPEEDPALPRLVLRHPRAPEVGHLADDPRGALVPAENERVPFQ